MLTGSCLCGGIRYEIAADHVGGIVHCHCSMCRRAQGSAFRTRAAVPRAQFRFVQGEALLSEYRSSANTVRTFCRVCGSPLVNRWAEDPEHCGLALGTLDQDPGTRPLRHIHVGSKAPWYEIRDALPRHDAGAGAQRVHGSAEAARALDAGAPYRIVEANLADPRHAAGAVEVLDSYAGDPIGGGQPLSPEVRERLIPALRARDNALLWLAFEGERAIGLAVCFVGFSTFAARPLLNLHDLAVLPAQRGRGVGRALLDALEERARQLGCCKITLEVQQDNTRARALYKSTGFADYSVGPDPMLTLFLEKRLRERSASQR